MGKVVLMGAGPGDPELLTVKAARLLKQADVVLHDALVGEPILELVKPGATVIDVGKRHRQKLLTQAEINSLLLSFAKTTDIVVRLKCGDPLIFGRAGEEIEALVEADIPFEIVPGITSALAGAAAAGVSLTDRRYASSVVFTTVHRCPGNDELEWERVVSSRATLVIYMPGNDYHELTTRLYATGVSPETPCTVVSSAGRPSQQVLWSDIGTLACHNALPAPSLVIVGQCAANPAQLRAACRQGDMAIATENPTRSMTNPICE
jgi:uroporphyrin-III C-methyltransferase